MNRNPLGSPAPHPRGDDPADEESSPGLFVVLLTYTAPLARIDDLLDAHRGWLDQQYAEGRFLVSGPQVPRSGGVIIARAGSREAMLDVIGTDPFFRAGAASYEIVQFAPTRGPLAAALRIGP